MLAELSLKKYLGQQQRYLTLPSQNLKEPIKNLASGFIFFKLMRCAAEPLCVRDLPRSPLMAARHRRKLPALKRSFLGTLWEGLTIADSVAELQELLAVIRRQVYIDFSLAATITTRCYCQRCRKGALTQLFDVHPLAIV